MTQATRQSQDNVKAALHVSIELSKQKWKLGFSDGQAKRPRMKTIEARDFDRFQEEITQAKTRFGLAEGAPVRCCFEAGRDGFWIQRVLERFGIDTVVVDPASVEVNRRRRRAKTDRLDAIKLVTGLVRHHRGEKVWSVVRVPSVAEEDCRQLHRDLEVLKGERRDHRMRIQSLLFTHGIDRRVGRKFMKGLSSLKQWDGKPLPPVLEARLVREYQRLALVGDQILELEKKRKDLLASCPTKSIEKARLLAQLCGIGDHGSWILAMEFFGWRQFSNRRQVGGAAGLTGTPHDSGNSERDQGISKAGNKRVRSLMIELSWCWLRYQPDSKLSRWFMQRFGGGGTRMRRVGIVALARRLLIDLWRLVEFGIVPDGARLKTV